VTGRHDIRAHPGKGDVTPVDHDRDPLWWRETSPGPGSETTPVLFVHGLGGSRVAWDPQLSALGSTRRCLAPELPGYGGSPPEPDMGFHDLADLLARFITDTVGGPAHVVGLSMGGMVAQHLALRHPDRVAGLVLLDTSPAFGIDGTDALEWKRLRLDALDRGLTPAEMAEGVLRSVGGPGLTGPALAAAVAAMGRVTAEGLRAAVEMLPTHDLSTQLHLITAPTLVAVGELDTETPPLYSRMLASGIPDARLRFITGSGHLSNLEEPRQVNRLLEDFLDEIDRQVSEAAT